MTALTRKPATSVSQKLIELLEAARAPDHDGQTPSFSESLDALEVEVFENCMPDAMLLMVRAAREALEFGDRIAMGHRRALLPPIQLLADATAHRSPPTSAQLSANAGLGATASFAEGPAP